MGSNYRLIHKSSDSSARAGELITSHGHVPTPAFMPVGTQATVKTMTPDEIKEIGYKIILSNTYHLYLRPGMDVLERMGGLHNFMGWDRPILTDSGGYQVFSMSPLRQINEEGVTFRSHIDGSTHLLTPELAVRYQEIIGADVIMVLDECTATDVSYEKVEKAMQRTHRWAERCLKAQKRPEQSLYAIVQGGVFPELRKKSVEYLTSLDFPGYAIGGLCLGEPKEKMWEMVSGVTAELPEDKTRYLMGVGSPEDLIKGIELGIDLFDCALPTRVARNGALFTWHGRRNIKNAVFATMKEPFELECNCYACRNFSAAYLHHLFMSSEILGLRLATIHNLSFIYRLMQRARKSVLNNTFDAFKHDFLKNYIATDEVIRSSQKQKWLKMREIE